VGLNAHWDGGLFQPVEHQDAEEIGHLERAGIARGGVELSKVRHRTRITAPVLLSAKEVHDVLSRLCEALQMLKRFFRREPDLPDDPYASVRAPKKPRPAGRSAAAVAELEP